MIIGRIIGKTSTKNFKFLVNGDAKKFDYLQLMHGSHFVLGQILEMEKEASETLAYCEIIGYRDSEGKLQTPRTPLEPGLEVLRASDDFIKEVMGLEETKNVGAYIGLLEGREKIRIYLDINKLLTKHVSILAKTGAGKSFFCGVLLEELLEKKVPVVVIDPHGEYSSLKYASAQPSVELERFGVEAKGYLKSIEEFSPDTKTNPEGKALKLSCKNLTSAELVHLFPTKLSTSQLGLIYSALKNLGGTANFDELIFELENEESNAKWALINIMEYMRKLNLFSEDPTLMGDIVRSGKLSLINLKGVPPDVQEVIVFKLVNDLFEERKKGNIPPFFLVVEEGHNYIPERSFGEKRSSAILRQIFAEGRKFGLGICLITQRPSRIEKNALSQVNTQIILKMTNPNDLKAVSTSVDGITSITEKEIPNLPVGTALVTGVVDLPLVVNVRPRRTKHGGEAVKIFCEEQPEQISGEISGEMMPIINQRITPNDVRTMYDQPVRIKNILYPCIMLNCSDNKEEFNLLIDLVEAKILKNIENGEGKFLGELKLEGLSMQQSKVFQMAIQLKQFKAAELFSKSGVQFSELYDIINTLTRKGYLEKTGENFRLSPQLGEFLNLKEYASYEKVDYERINVDEKIEPKHGFSEIKDMLSKFLEIKNAKECWLVRYGVE
ncbi:ATP-binding protein [Candidatus Woesearchaeota archaeon]|nr:ATP-binding protein [Candidatus Woesearchaeota archaeon]